jgi:hypothetical protein
LRLDADRLEAYDALLQRWVVEIGNAGLDRVMETLQAQVCLGDVLAATLGQDFLETSCSAWRAVETRK